MTHAIPGLRAIFFDAGNTLLHPHPSVGHIYSAIAARHGQHLAKEWVETRFQEAWASRHELKLPSHDHEEKEFWRHMVRRVFHGVFAEEHFERFFEELYASFAEPTHWRLFPETRDTLEKIQKQGFTLGIVSNWDSRLMILCEQLKLVEMFDFIVISAVEGVAKPHREIFDRALQRAGVAAHEALHIGDSYREDYEGATQAGLHAVLIDRHHIPAIPHLKAVQSLTGLLDFLPQR